MNNDYQAKLKDILAKNDYSLTKPRLLVLEALKDQPPISVNKLISKISRQADRASIYRTIKLFEALGIIQRLNYGFKYRIELSDLFSEHHHHLTCIKCNKVIAINETELENFITKTAKANNFKASTHQLEIQGLCQKCALAKSAA